ncbi:SLAC1 anion channel family protein [Campylobacter geochelonis]|uniref:C4-dicarboxylate transporter/malic acid transport protein n=1 Tax=Campylobacter geochelonis TaxID=1780362 RepID=A0A128EE37_9BACT|nr:SLAC1 anion channel family protein [Campylobacter geochelonis]QKF71041.1 tellurite-resistance/dicarboxylate transporter (TDT) family protein [Campylobacter geochelonis]CZE47210.1 C4-dicarboxylate transporter/malic acid transport protein [Campylobacter geochelonis]CZE50143.1 C4-dicarboxylate transporter/malic acid transport protein [Campylobacter geochelonis]
MKESIKFLPISLFGSVMGLCGFSVGMKHYAHVIENDGFKSIVMGLGVLLEVLAFVSFIALCVAYIAKMVMFFENVKAEWKNPVTKSFFGTFFIAILLLPLLIADYSLTLARIVWSIGAIGMACFAVYVVSTWIMNAHEVAHNTPAWIVPVVGTLDIPLAAWLFKDSVEIHYFSIAALSVGLFFAVPLVTLILSRIIFFQKLPEKLMPTLMILIAPFAVGFLAYHSQFPTVDNFSLGLYFIGIFVFLAVSGQLLNLSKCCVFRVSWWAVSFPLAALFNATVALAGSPLSQNTWLFSALAVVMFVICVVIFIWLVYRSVSGILQGELANLA